MEWNGKSLGQWDWEHLFFFNAKATENPKFQPTDNCSGEVDREINVGMLYPSGGSACSGSELIHASSSRSSKSASNNSSSNGDSKASILTLEGSQDDSTGKKELCNGEPVETSPTAVPSPVSGEPLLTLKLGKRLYFEDVCTGNDAKKPSCKVPVSSGKKYKTSNQNLQHPICQVEGCGLDLSPAKDYHRKHRVCETHSKSPKVVVAGLERRFCQQCSRFHSLSEFDDKKRSCRRRLSDHNARRRKPQPNTMQLNPSALSSPYGITAGRQTMNPFAFSRTATNLAWQEMHNSKFPHTKDLLPKPTKAFNKIPSIVSMLSNDSSGLLTSRGIATKSIVPGLADPITSCDPDTTTTQAVNRALSLLSTNPWGAYETKSLSLDHSTRTSDITQSVTHAINQRLPPHLSDYWHTDQPQQPPPSTMCISFSDCDNSNRFQDFQLLSAPYESGFPCNPLD